MFWVIILPVGSPGAKSLLGIWPYHRSAISLTFDALVRGLLWGGLLHTLIEVKNSTGERAMCSSGGLLSFFIGDVELRQIVVEETEAVF